ncbi:MAG: metallophosphoesterase family protein [Planctomycetota bacterium]|jgi:putative phosphoesterase
MKILLISDIHSNWPALRAIDETFDACLFAGDLVDYATDPVPCIDWVRKHVTASVRGNHDHAVAQRIPVRKKNGLSRLAAQARPVHWDVLSSDDLKLLARMPVTRRLELDGRTFYMVHATPRDPFDEYLKRDAEAWQQRLSDIDADYAIVGHSHTQFVLDIGRTTVINPGSVGQPRDGDPRAAYCVIEDGEVRMERVEYEISETVEQMYQSGVRGEILDLASHFLRTGGRMPTTGTSESQ